jgi:hypothetical protein
MRTALVQVSENIQTAQNDPFSPARLLSDTSKEALQILAQSTLNSMELQNLLKLVEPDPQQQLLGVAPSPGIPHTISSQPLNVLTGMCGPVSDFTRFFQVSLQKTIRSPLHKYLASAGRNGRANGNTSSCIFHLSERYRPASCGRAPQPSPVI